MKELTEGRVRGIVREEMHKALQDGITEATTTITQEFVRDVVRAEIADLKDGVVSSVVSESIVAQLKDGVVSGVKQALAEGASNGEIVSSLSRAMDGKGNA